MVIIYKLFAYEIICEYNIKLKGGKTLKSAFVFFKIAFKAIKANKSVYLLFFVSMALIIASIVALYSVEYDKTVRNETREDNLTMDVEVKGLNESHIEYLQSLLQRDYVQNIELCSDEFNVEKPKKNKNGYKISRDKYVFYAKLDPYGSEEENSVFHTKGESISPSDAENYANRVVAPEGYFKGTDLKYGDVVNIDGNDYTLIGETGLSISQTEADPFIIPYTTMLRRENTAVMSVIFEPGADSSVFSFVEKEMYNNTLFKVTAVYSPKIYEEIEYYSAQEKMTAAFMFIIAFISIAYIYQYLLEKRNKTFAVYRIVGCSRIKGQIMMLAESLIVFTAAFALGTAAGQAACRYLLPLLLGTEPVEVYAEGVLYVYLISLATMAAGVIIIDFLYFRRKQIAHLKESEAD